MAMRKVKLGNRVYDTITLDEYYDNPEAYPKQYTAIDCPEQNLVLPILNNFDTRVGIKPAGLVNFFNVPSDKERDQYSRSNIIDFADCKNIKELIEKNDIVKSMENDILISPENIFSPRISERDTPEMKGMKEAIISKHIDIKSYEKRFNGNLANDTRLYNGNSITLSKLKDHARIFDMKATLIIEDRDTNVPNPIGRKIVIDLLPNNSDDDEEENPND